MARKLSLKVMLSPGDLCTLTAAIESLHATYPGLTATMTAVNSGTGNQTTTWTYGTTLSTSGVARNDLLASVMSVIT